MYRGPGGDIVEVFDLFAKTFLSNQRGFHVKTSLSLNLDTIKSIAVSEFFYHHSTWGIRVFKRGPMVNLVFITAFGLKQVSE